jgi:hypothetical protein
MRLAANVTGFRDPADLHSDSSAIAFAESAEPALNPNHPNPSIPVPKENIWNIRSDVDPTILVAPRAPKNDRACQRSETCGYVDDGTAGEV